jgi:transcriptional regulator with XRE-family HTH domain
LTVGSRLHEERLRLGLNQTDFGAIGGVTKATQINYEKGERSPDANYLLAVTARGVDLMYVLTGVRGEHTERPLTADQAVLLDRYAQVSDEGKAALRMVLEAMASHYRAG